MVYPNPQFSWIQVLDRYGELTKIWRKPISRRDSGLSLLFITLIEVNCRNNNFNTLRYGDFTNRTQDRVPFTSQLQARIMIIAIIITGEDLFRSPKLMGNLEFNNLRTHTVTMFIFIVLTPFFILRFFISLFSFA